MTSNSNASSSNDRTEKEPVIEMDHYYGCIRVNGILFPQPLRSVPLESSPSPPPPPQPEEATPDKQQAREQAEVSGERPQRKRRCLTATRVVETKQLSLALLKCDEQEQEQEQEHILETREVDTGNTMHYMLSFYEKLGKMKIEAKEVPLGGRVVSPVTEEVYANAPSKYNLSIKERLEGAWTTEVRERRETTKTENFYIHQKVNKTIRSISDVATFIIYGEIY